MKHKEGRKKERKKESARKKTEICVFSVVLLLHQ
jgi:hypothetical protein